MVITDVKPFVVDCFRTNWVFVKVYTDEGVTGVYDFSWLDEIVDELRARSIEPWINLVYGHPLYTEIANDFFGAVGCVPLEGEALTAWLNYVRALVVHMKGRVTMFEIWNEPDNRFAWRIGGKLEGKKGTPNGREYGEFAIATAKAIREVSSEAYIIGFALGHPETHLGFITAAMDTGLGDWIDGASYHSYLTDSLSRVHCYEIFASSIHSYNPKIDIIQGESGTQSQYSYAGALKKKPWSLEKQMKFLLREMVTDLAHDCKFVSYFSSLDMVEALSGLLSDKKSYMDYGYFGVLSADFDENGIATGSYTPKPSYKALQNIASLFEGNTKQTEIPHFFYVNPLDAITDYAGSEMMSYGFTLNDGRKLLTYWRDADLLTTTFEGTISIRLATGEIPELIDLQDGTIYEIPQELITVTNETTALVSIPLRDYPLALRWK